MTDQVAEPASTDENRPPETGPPETGPADTADTADTAGTRPPARVGLLAIAAGLVLAADVATKVAAVAQLEGERPVRLLGGAAYLVLFRNSGAAFSMATGLTWLLTLIAIAVVIVIIRLAPKLRSPGWAIGLGLVLGGAAGNLVDRLFRAPGPLRGHVIDFFSVFAPDGSVFPVFNVADSAIVVGGLLLMLLAVLGHDYDGTRHRGREEPAG
ncbi:MAG TPA: signal peptidase II [Pseudonocardiaceae bacterium]|nr:signal peptidase II [Pseudonocardiaceae bacterium]